MIVPTRDRPHLLDDCLASLVASLRPIDELIVVDSASSVTAVREVAASHGARYIRTEVPGASTARNLGWRSARNELVAFVDDDVRVEPGWAAGLARAFTDPGTTFVTGRIGDPPPPAGGRAVSGPPVAQKVDAEPARLGPATPGILGHSANLAVRRRALEHIGGFDQLLGAGGRFRAAEDLDLFDRLFAAGYIGRYEPAASGFHEPWRRKRDYVRLQSSYGFGVGARVAKLLRTDRARARRAARTAFVDWGFSQIVRSIRARSLARFLAWSLRLLTTVAGFAAAVIVPVRDGHLGGRRYVQ